MTTHTLPIALLQMRSGTDAAENVAAVRAGVREAAAAGARLVATPEMTVCLDRRPGALLAQAHAQAQDPSVRALCDIAREAGVDLLVGSLAVRVGPQHLANRSLLIDAAGQIVAHYDKIHLFDVDLGPGERYQESARFVPGDRAVLAAREGYTLGLSICYDLRFAGLYRTLAQAGAQVLTIPSAFTVPTGRAHWEVLLRARAIETGCYVLAPAQHGVHADGRETYGHSMVIDPWGQIVAVRAQEPGLLLATLDLDAVAQARRRLPSLQHDRAYAQPPHVTGR